MRYLGSLAETDKPAALAGAPAVLCPSPYESLSIVLLEALAVGTPGLAKARSAVLDEHCRRSNAGLCYEDGTESARRWPRSRATTGCGRPSARAAGATWRRSTAGR